MFQGELLGIFLAADRGIEPKAVASAETVAGQGLKGDRYFQANGAKDPGTELTLIETEALAALAANYQIELAPQRSRRNLLTRGVPLNHLVGKEFQIGDVRLRGIRLCEPCGHLEKLTVEGVRKGLIHRGGLRAQIVEGGMIRVGDKVRLAVAG
jgi:MOSC domain-containing protein YiiM